MIYHLFQNSVWKVVKIAKTSNLKSAVKSQSITTVPVERSTTELWPLADKSDLSGVFIYFICVFFIFFGWPRGGRRGLGAYKWCIKAENVVKIKQSTMFTCSSVTL